MTPEEVAKLRIQIERHGRILGMMDPDHRARVAARAEAARTARETAQAQDAAGKWQRIQLLISELATNFPADLPFHGTLNELRAEVQHVATQSDPSAEAFEALVNELLPRVEDAAEKAQVLSAITYQ